MNQLLYKTRNFTHRRIGLTKQKVLTKLILKAPKVSKENLSRIISFLSLISPKDEESRKGNKSALDAMNRLLKSDNPCFINIVKRFDKELSPKVKEKFVENFFVNNLFLNRDVREDFSKSYGFKPPFFFVMSPTMRCNLTCEGCYAGKYDKEELSFELMDRLMNEAKEMGIYFITVSGGEPFVRKDDLLRLFVKHNDMFFQVYTNGTLVTKELAKRLAEVGNVSCGISVEGFEADTDLRRGRGVFKKVMEAMDNLREAGVIYGFSATPTKRNTELLASEKFFDFVLEKGCFFGWFFQYIPIGMNPDVSLMASPEQRNKFREQLKKLRSENPIFIGDFWNDGPYVHGCMAGGSKYFHINSNGDAEPCVFFHFAVDNVKSKSLKEILNSDFFKAIRAHQPYSENLLTPCAVIDNPKVMREVCAKYSAYPTHKGSDTIIRDERIIKHLDGYSERFKEVTQPVWDKKAY